MFWRSVVGKLSVTILLLVSFVLFILTIMLLQFFESYHISKAEEDLTQLSTRIAKVIQQYDERDLAYSIAWEMLDSSSNGLIVEKGRLHYSPNYKHYEESSEFIYQDPDMIRVLENGVSVKKVTDIPYLQENNEMIMVGVPIKKDSAIIGGVFLYQSLDVVNQTSKQTTKIILLSAAVAIVLTTVFAIFLSTRITAPLRKMREAAFEVAKGKFDTKVPILTHDEIGELALAFNRMGRQLEFHITELNQEKEQLSGILSSMADGVITMSRKGEILVSNPPASRFLESFSFDKGSHINGKKELPKQMNDLLEQVISKEKVQDFEITIQGRSWVILMTPLYGGNNIRGAVAVLRDMTEERRLDKLRKDFIANVSHELRTPISMLQGYSEAIVDDIAATEEEKKEIAQVIYEESLRMGRLVNELLDLARMEAGHIQLYLDEVDMNKFTKRIVRKFQGLAKEKGVSVQSNLPSEFKIMNIDEDRIEQVLTNLIDNAIRHTETGGSVYVVLTSQELGVKFDIQDSGVGIPEEDLPFVFERFYKADKARTRGRAGTGLGLAIVRNIVEAHNGHVAVHSKQGEGTTFSFFLPYEMNQ